MIQILYVWQQPRELITNGIRKPSGRGSRLSEDNESHRGRPEGTKVFLLPNVVQLSVLATNFLTLQV